MKKIIVSLLIVVSFCAEAQIQTPAPSPQATLTTRVALTDVKITYYRPRMRGRKIFGAGTEFVVPFNKIWRTGANNGTIITFSDDVEVDGKKVPKGEYVLFTIPGATEWTVMLYKDLTIGGDTDAYKVENEVAKITVKPEKLTERMEMLTFNIADLSDDNTTAKIQLAWENTSVKIPLKVDFDTKVMKAIEANTKVNPNSYFAAANYYFNTNRDLKKALEWVDLGLASNPDQYWNVHLKAKIQKALGDKAGAKVTAQKSLELSKKENDGAYIKQNEDLISSLK